MAGPALDLTGRRFGNLIAKEKLPARNGRRLWLCICDCGSETKAQAGHLRAGIRLSCGCRMPESKKTHGMSRSPEYRAWENARARCRNPKVKRYPLYGGRGIRMCDEWASSFEAFIRDMGRRPSSSHSLDRLDSNGHYEPGNCRWATAAQQNNNRSINRHVIVRGSRMTVAEASRLTGIPHATILGRLDRGYPDDEAVRNG